MASQFNCGLELWGSNEFYTQRRSAGHARGVEAGQREAGFQRGELPQVCRHEAVVSAEDLARRHCVRPARSPSPPALNVCKRGEGSCVTEYALSGPLWRQKGQKGGCQSVRPWLSVHGYERTVARV